MSEYVWSHADALLADGRWHVRLNRGEAWWADDPVVQAYPELFSATPLSVAGSTGRPQPGITPIEVKPPLRASVPVIDDAERAVRAINAADLDRAPLAESDPTVEAVVTADRRRARRG